MKKTLISKLNMYQAVQQVLKANNGLSKGFSRLNTEVLNFEQTIARINELNANLSAGTAGITNANSQLEQNMTEAICKLARVALVWAKDTSNMALINLFDVTKSDFTKVSDAACSAKANAILAQIEANSKDLANEVNIKTTAISAARKLVNDYQASLGTAQSAVKANKGLNAETNELFAKADVSLVIINDLVVNALDEPAFANAFMATKVINDAAVRSTGVSIAVTNAATNEPITSAWAYVEGKDKKDDADQDGICELYKIRPGIYTIRIEAEGYQTQTLTATIEQGKITELEISLNKS
jgi:hypothetical protein